MANHTLAWKPSFWSIDTFKLHVCEVVWSHGFRLEIIFTALVVITYHQRTFKRFTARTNCNVETSILDLLAEVFDLHLLIGDDPTIRISYGQVIILNLVQIEQNVFGSSIRYSRFGSG